MRTYLTRARLVTATDVIEDASVLIEDGYIAAINPVSVQNTEVIDLNHLYLIPGLIDLHCDAIEKEIEPRPNAFFPIDFAIAQIDQRSAAAGITTPFHAISFAQEELGVRSNEKAAEIVRAVHSYQPYASVDNHIHCRYEITDPTGLPILLQLLEERQVHLISLMDHTPGQGQFKDLQAFQTYFSRTYHKTTVEIKALVQRKIEQAAGVLERVNTLVTAAQSYQVPVASHDDDSPERIAQMRALGVRISEFPINLPTAQAAQAAGLYTVFGAPNVLRGQSQSGSMRAIDAIHHQVGDILCADYAPASLLAAAFQIPQLTSLSLPKALALVTRNPALAVGLRDRGEIAVGKRADLVAVQTVHTFPKVLSTWVQGHRVYQSQPRV